MNKYKAVKTKLDGYTFDSKKEAKEYAELKIRLIAGEITDLEIQPSFKCVVNGRHICTYYADFAYFEKTSEKHVRRVVKDVKSEITRKNAVYRLKKKLVEALHPITIEEV